MQMTCPTGRIPIAFRSLALDPSAPEIPQGAFSWVEGVARNPLGRNTGLSCALDPKAFKRDLRRV